MGESRAAVLQGTLDLLILKALSAGELHGLGVSRRIEQITRGTFSVQPGSLFPALHRLEEAGALSSSWQPSENNRRAKYYTLTKGGRRRLGEETAEWNRIALAIARALEAVEVDMNERQEPAGIFVHQRKRRARHLVGVDSEAFGETLDEGRLASAKIPREQ